MKALKDRPRPKGKKPPSRQFIQQMNQTEYGVKVSVVETPPILQPPAAAAKPIDKKKAKPVVKDDSKNLKKTKPIEQKKSTPTPPPALPIKTRPFISSTVVKETVTSGEILAVEQPILVDGIVNAAVEVEITSVNEKSLNEIVALEEITPASENIPETLTAVDEITIASENIPNKEAAAAAGEITQTNENIIGKVASVEEVTTAGANISTETTPVVLITPPAEESMNKTPPAEEVTTADTNNETTPAKEITSVFADVPTEVSPEEEITPSDANILTETTVKPNDDKMEQVEMDDVIVKFRTLSETAPSRPTKVSVKLSPSMKGVTPEITPKRKGPPPLVPKKISLREKPNFVETAPIAQPQQAMQPKNFDTADAIFSTLPNKIISPVPGPSSRAHEEYSFTSHTSKTYSVSARTSQDNRVPYKIMKKRISCIENADPEFVRLLQGTPPNELDELDECNAQDSITPGSTADSPKMEQPEIIHQRNKMNKKLLHLKLEMEKKSIRKLSNSRRIRSSDDGTSLEISRSGDERRSSVSPINKKRRGESICTSDDECKNNLFVDDGDIDGDRDGDGDGDGDRDGDRDRDEDRDGDRDGDGARDGDGHRDRDEEPASGRCSVNSQSPGLITKSSPLVDKSEKPPK